MNIEPLHIRLLKARKAKAISQVALSKKVGCTQSALSMMEGGKADALSKETVAKIAEILEVKIEKETEEISSVSANSGLYAICPNGECPSCVPYPIGNNIAFYPKLQPASATFCSFCGEVLEKVCGKCDTPVSAGAFCPKCGEARVMLPASAEDNPLAWLEKRRAEIEKFNHLI